MRLLMNVSTCHNIALIHGTCTYTCSYSHWWNVFPAFPFLEFESAQGRTIVSSKIKFAAALFCLKNFLFFLELFNKKFATTFICSSCGTKLIGLFSDAPNGI